MIILSFKADFIISYHTVCAIMQDISALLTEYAARYETADFLYGDPSWFMHQVNGDANKEVTAFIASCLSYGSRKQFMPKIQQIVDFADGDVYSWVLSGDYENDIKDDNGTCFYRLYTQHTIRALLDALRQMLQEYGTIGQFVRRNATDGLSAVKALTAFFAAHGIETIIPKNATSACKRVCMFLRWMVRSGSPVDLGLWADSIDRRTLIMPMDTHVLQEGNRLGLISNKTASMSVAVRLTNRLAKVFPDDPLKGDFALFGYGVNQDYLTVRSEPTL